MVGGQLTKVRKKKERVPIAIVPSKVVPKQQLAALQQSLKQVTASISSLQKFAGSLSVKKPDPKDVQYQMYIDNHCDRIKRAVAKIPIHTLPLVGYRFGNYVAWLGKTIEEARKLGKLGELGKFWTSMDIVKKQLDAIGRVLTLQNDFLNKGIPQNVKVGDADQPVEWLLESLARVIRTVGTPNEALYRSAVKAMELYIANAELYNTDDLNTRRERDTLIKFIIDKGEKARELQRTRKAYTKKEIARDQRRLRSFERNIKVMKAQLRAYNISVFTRWIAAIDLKLKDRTMELQLKDSMTALRLEINGMLAKTRKGLPLDQKETSELSNRYYRLVEGKEAPMTTTEWLDSLGKRAAGLRGKGRVVGTGTPQWWGKHALELLRVDRPNLAALAIAMGTLEASASKVTRKGAKEYVSSYWRIRNAVKRGLAITPGMRAVYARQVELGSIIVEADLIAKRFARRGSAARRKLLLSVLTLVRRRMDKGDFAGAMRIMDMAKAYGSLMLQYGRRSWTGAKQMDDALRAERDKGKDASELFSRGIASHVFSLEVRKCSKAIRYWSRRGMRAQFQVAESVLKKTEQFAAAGKLKDARRLLTLVVMYIDAAGRLGTTGTASLKGMESALAAIMAGKTSVAGAGIEKTFLESYHLTQNTYFGNSLKQVGQMRKWWPIGGSVIKAAMATISERAKNGDYRGAYILLNYVQEFYGKTGKGKKLGWRYKLAAREYIREKIKGYNAGVWGMLEAIKKEMKAKTPREQAVAAQFFDKGTAKIADTHELQKILAKLKAKHKTVPLIIRRYEHNNPDDPVLKGGRTLAQLMTTMTGAANSGDVRTYNNSIKVFNKRFTIVAARAKRRATIDAWLKGLARMGKAVDGLLKIYAGGTRGESVATARLGGLKDRMTKLTATLKTLTKVRDPLVAREFLEFVQLGKLIKKEGRRARAYTLIINQIKLNGNYMKMVSAGSGNLAAMAKSAIRAANRELHNALRAALSGRRQDAESAYKAAMGWRRQAMVAFCAENAGKVSAVRAWISLFKGTIGQRGARIRASYAPYIRLQMAAFRNLVGKTPSKDDLVLGERMLQMARATEVSVFAIPSTNLSQQFSSSLASNQKAILALATKTLTAFNAGSLTLASMNRNLKSALARWKALEYRARRNAKIGNVIATVAALAMTLFPPTSLLGGAIFTTMAWDRVATEYSIRGKASGESWFWLGFTVATLGIGGSAGMVRGWANSAKAVGATSASRLLVTARVLEYTTLAIGLGFAAYAIPQAYKAWRKGEYFDAVFLAGMALFPFALMGGAYAWRAVAARRAGRSLPTEVREVVENTLPEQAAVDIAITGSKRARRGDAVRSLEGLLAFLGKYMKKGTRGRQRMLETLPENMRDTVSQLASHKAVLEAIKAHQKGAAIPNMAKGLLDRALKSFEEGPKPEPTGPRGARTEWEASTWLGDQGLAAFRDFIADLLVPEGAPAGRLNARAGARTRLEALRADNPKAAKAIDRLLTSLKENDIARNSLQRNRWNNPNLNKLINEARTELGNVIPKRVQSAENQAVGTYHQELVMVAGGEPIVITRPGRPVIAPAPRTVASAGGGKPPPLTPGQVSAGAMGGAATRRGAAPAAGGKVISAPSKEAAAAKAAAEGATEVRIVKYRWYNKLLDRYKGRKAEKTAAKEAKEKAAAELEAGLTEATEPALRELIEITHDLDAHGARLDEMAKAGLTSEEAKTAVRMAPQRMADIVKSIYERLNDPLVPNETKGPLRVMLSKIYAHKNVREALTSVSNNYKGYQVLKEIARQAKEITLKAAHDNGKTLTEWRSALRERVRKPEEKGGGFKEEMPHLIETLESQPAELRAQLRERMKVVEGRMDRLEARLEKPSWLSRFKTKARREAGRQRLIKRLDDAKAELAGLKTQLMAEENAPLAATQNLLGRELSPAQRVAALKALKEKNLVMGGDIMFEVREARGTANSRLDYIDTTNKPLATALKKQMAKEMETAPLGTPLDEILLRALKSKDMEKAVSSTYKAPDVIKRFQDAVKGENLGEVLAALGKASPTLSKEISPFITKAQGELAGPFTIMNRLAELYTDAVNSGDLSIAAAGLQVQPMRFRVKSWLGRAWASWWLRIPTTRWFSIRQKPYTIFSYFAERSHWLLKTLPRSAFLRRWRIGFFFGLQLAVWTASAFGTYRFMEWLVRQDPKDVEDICMKNHGAKCTRAQLLEVKSHPDFYRYVQSKLIEGPELRPGSPDALKKALKSNRWDINRQRIGEIIDIGKNIRINLPRINTLLMIRAKGKPEQKKAAETQLKIILKKWGITDLVQIDKMLEEKKALGAAEVLNIGDMAELAREHFYGKGLMWRPRDRIIGQFFVDIGLPENKRKDSREFLLKNTDVFVSLWTAFQKGYLPRIHMSDAVAALAAPGIISGIRAKVKAGKKLDDAVVKVLLGKKLYLSARVAPASFLDRLDDRVTGDPKKRAAFSALLKGYLADKDKLEVLGNFIVGKDQEIYGDPKAFAEEILKIAKLKKEHKDATNLNKDYRAAVRAKDTAKIAKLKAKIDAGVNSKENMAKRRAEIDKKTSEVYLDHVGSAVLAGILKYPPALQKRIVRLVNSKSNKRNQGIMAWIKNNKDDITDLPAILRYLALQTKRAETMSAADYYDAGTKKGYLVNQESVFIRTRNWMRQPSKFGKKGRRPIKRRPMTPKQRVALFMKLSQEERIRMVRGLSDKERSGMLRLFTEKQREIYERLPKNARVAVGLKGTGAPSAKTAVPSKIEKPIPASEAIKKLIPPRGAIDTFYKTLKGNELGQYLNKMLTDLWKRKGDRNAMFRTYHRAIKGPGNLTPALIKTYTRQKKEVLSTFLAYVKKEAYLTLSGKKTSGIGMLKSAGFTGKMVNNQLEVTIGDVSPKSLRGYLKTYIITPLSRSR